MRPMLKGTLAIGAAVAVGFMAGQISAPTSTFLPLDPPLPFESDLPNPFSLPGILINRPVLPLERDVNKPYGLYDQVRWKSFPSTTTRRLESNDPDGLEETDLGAEEEETSLLEELKIAHEKGIIPEGWSDWGVNKTIIGIGDSLMRDNVGFFTQHISRGDVRRKVYPYRDELGSQWGGSHHQGVVDVPVIDLKMINLFHQGMVESPVDGFFYNQSLPQRFEDKLADVFLPSLVDPQGLNGRVPDLIIFETLSWDLALLSNLARSCGDHRYAGRPLDDGEIAFLRGRIFEVLGVLRTTFPTTKIILQTPHLGAKPAHHVFSPIRKFQQAQIMHSVALETGVELFDWGRIVSPLSHEMADGLHFHPGAATWIWGEMLLYFLQRTSLSKVLPPPAASQLPSSRFTQQDLTDSYSQPRQQYGNPTTARRRSSAEDSDLEEAMRLLSK
ncbi:hypothetical protein BDY24DRAFT_168237 [Mrakia frigida]|uniref:uncharacterized protein n=1 Tax=Mrakia frigida TaxID=29902 RepID=UPI003FCC1505